MTSIEEVNENTDDFMHEDGRTIRWRRIYEESEPEYKRECYGWRKGERIHTDIESEKFLENMNEDLYERLEARRRAISNWKRLKIVIVILKMCNGRIDEGATTPAIEQEKPEVKQQTFDDWFSSFVIKPNHNYILAWNLFATLVYLVSIFLDSLIIGFHLHPLKVPGVTTC